MLRIKLNEDGIFEVYNIEIFSKEKNGKIIGWDENKKPIYEQIPATVWKTSEGNFNYNGLDKPKVCKIGASVEFEIMTEGDENVAKASLKQFAFEYFGNIITRCTERIDTLSQQVNEYNLTVLRASEALKTLSEVKNEM